jgi:hypothetical protein
LSARNFHHEKIPRKRRGKMKHKVPGKIRGKSTSIPGIFIFHWNLEVKNFGGTGY